MQKRNFSGVARQNSSSSMDIVSDARSGPELETVIERPAKKAATSCNSFRMNGGDNSKRQGWQRQLSRKNLSKKISYLKAELGGYHFGKSFM